MSKVVVRRKPRAKAVRGRGAYYMPNVIKGKGAYQRVRNRNVRGKGGYIGDFLSNIGSRAGSALGNFVGKGIESITGLGSYKVNKNSLITPDPPTIQNSSAGVIVRHREYIQDIYGTIAFKQQFENGLPLNPGMFKSFPWLSGIASNYTQYKWRGIIFEFVPTSGSAIASTNNALGEVIMATNYNACDALFSNKQQMLNQEFSSSGMPSSHLMHPIECDPKLSTLDKLYTRSGAVPDNQDLRMYDLGLFQLATGGMQADNINVGELWATYEVEFFKPQFITQSDEAQEHAHYWLGNASSSTPFGSASTDRTKKVDTLGLSFTESTITIPAGYQGDFTLSYMVFSDTNATISAPTFTLSNAEFGADLRAGNNSAISAPQNGVSANRYCYILDFIITDNSKETVISMGASTLPWVGTYQIDMKITRGAFYTSS